MWEKPALALATGGGPDPSLPPARQMPAGMASLALLALLVASAAKTAPAEMGWEPQAAEGLPGGGG